jgi:hypothetical protein
MYRLSRLDEWDRLKYNMTENGWELFTSRCDIIVKGEQDSPNCEYLDMAKDVISKIDEYESISIRFLNTFLKEQDGWGIGSFDFGCCYSKSEYDFEINIGNKKDQYMNTYFIVSFYYNSSGSRPVRIEIGLQ